MSPWPVGVLRLKVDKLRLQQLLHKPNTQRLRELLREIPDSNVLLESFRIQRKEQLEEGANCDPVIDPNQEEEYDSVGLETVPVLDIETWIPRWLDGLQVRSGAFRLEKPRHLNSRSRVDGRGGTEDEFLRIQVDMQDWPVQELLDGLRWSIKLWNLALNDEKGRHRREVLASAPSSKPGPKPALPAMALHLVELGMDWHFEQLNRGMPMLVVGRGRGQRRLSQKLTDQTSGWGLHSVKQKVVTARLLAKAGLPAPAGGPVWTLRDAMVLAEKLGYPVVTKPANEDQGKGVVTNIESREVLQKAFRRSEQAGKPVLLQPQIIGRDFRFYVVKGKLLAGVERIPAHIRGDGSSKVRTLVEMENLRRWHSPIIMEGGGKSRFNRINLNQEAMHLLKAQGLTADSIPADGHTIQLSPSANFSMGGTVRECLAEVHPANRQILTKVGKIFHLDVVGIDVIAPTMEEPLHRNGGVICEVNGMPGILPHQLAEPNRKLMGETLALLLEDLVRPPLIAFHGGGITPTVINTLADALSETHPELAVVDRQGRRDGSIVWQQADSRNFNSYRQALSDPDVEAFLFELKSQSLMKDGLPWARTDLLVLLDGEAPMPQSWEHWLVSRAELVLASKDRSTHLPVGPAKVVMTSGESANEIAEQIILLLQRRQEARSISKWNTD
ncbi:hypothetical protein VB716_07725 [Synechococcus sp. CCY9201]|uniref:hypothetical protein n=1 Tax=Synechococcus sp. CCY9201 TaxID=174697 RepID=UPI002B1F7D33|nr:hypothetical protein [Synechococcus sp. CCY9201]MEA5474111.1 hypothetical protein [Synechococcus sp. CCY9201]